MRIVTSLALAMLLAACSDDASPGAPGSITTRLNGQTGFVAVVR